MRLRDAKQDLAAKKKDRESKRQVLADRLISTLESQVDAEALEEHLALASKQAEDRKREHDVLDGMRRCFSKFMEWAETSHECPVCERPFASPEEMDGFLKKQRVNQGQSAEKLRAAAAQSLEAEVRVKALAQLKPVSLEYQKLLREGIPGAEKAVREAEAALQNATEEHDDVLGVLGQMGAEHEEVRRLEGPVKEMERVAREAEALRREVEDAEYKLDVMAQGLRSMADVNAELGALEEKREEVVRRLERLREEQQRLKDDFTAWNLRWRNAREEKLQMMARLQQLNEAKGSLKRLDEQQRQAAIDLQAWEQKAEVAQREVEQLQAEQAGQNQRAQEEEEKRHSEARLRERDVDQLRNLNIKIEQ
eukprot:TRINITY_DN22081_c0_g2_i2.p2 TRINITY_DN22081_c0_g2~~TRINITY_DN22081_c0_g2_i2.p2  ORF type:complete len:366 (+),score=162.50 TRINITY_DN22081_c0_g2_i2:1365-2462(+)